MGYSTDFWGILTLSRDLTDVEKNYINEFSKMRHMARDIDALMAAYGGKHGNPRPESETAYGYYGEQGEFFANEDDESTGTLQANTPSHTQPGLWCQWIINEDNELEWDGGEKFYNYIEWLEYLIDKFFFKWGVLLDGEITWQGEENTDMGMIVVKNSEITIKYGKIVYE